MKRVVNYIRILRPNGFTLIEALIAIFLSGMVGAFALQFYVSQHNNLIVQQTISDMQQNLRVSVDEVSRKLLNAGASLPNDLMGLESFNTNPDTLIIRSSTFGGSVNVGEHTQVKHASPIHMAKGTDLSEFSVGQRVFLWHSGPKQGEWFTITKISTNNGSGWEQIHHQGQVLQFDPMPGDNLLSMSETKYFIDYTDSLAPLFMRSESGEQAQIYADNISDFQVEFYLTGNDTAYTLTPSDTAVMARIALSAFTAEEDYEAKDFGNSGRRSRELSTNVLIRNSRR